MLKGDWLNAAPEDENTRLDYSIRLLTLFARRVSEEQLQECIQKAGLPGQDSRSLTSSQNSEHPNLGERMHAAAMTLRQGGNS